MKRLLLLTVVFALCSLVLAQEKVEVDKNGEIRETQEKELNWRSLTHEEMQAYEQPGIEVPAGSFTQTSNRLDFFHYEKIKRFNKVVLYNGQKLLTLKKQLELKSEVEFAWHVVLLMLSIIFMVFFNIGYNKDNVAFAAVAAAFAFAAVAAAFAFAAVAAAFAFAFAFAAFAFAFAFAGVNKKLYYSFLVIYYVFAGIAMFI